MYSPISPTGYASPTPNNTAAVSFLQTPIEFLKGVGPQRAALLQRELEVYTYEDLLLHFPFRYVDA